jgi:DNA-binding SARP family transcriptional activator
MAAGLEFCLLGPLVVRCDGLAMPVPSGKPRAVLAALLLDACELVTVDKLAEVLWGADPPPSARVSVQNHVKRLRQALGDSGRTRIATRPGGYVMRLEAGELDVSRFQDSLARAQAAARDRRWERASAQASAALLLWRGEPLADAGSELLAQRVVPYLAEMSLQAQETRLEAEMQLGHYAEAIVELRRLAAAHPLREHLHGLLMLALLRCGRQGEALAAYQAARRTLIAELGAEPGPELRQVHQQILAGDAEAVATPDPVPPAAGTRPAVVPRQLPAPVRDFVGRQAELAALTSLLGRAVISTPATLVISAIGGAAGIGKTALAVHWAHQVAGQFPDGQLYLNLRGFHQSGRPMSSDEATRGLLDALNVPAQRIPASPDGQAALYRSMLSGKRMLILLDNARDAGQVRPLLPGSPGCLVLVTSRSQLPGLIAIEGAYALALDVLTEAEARELLARRLSQARLEAEPGAAAELIGLCARLPLALAIAAARASGRPWLPLSALAAELADSRRRLNMLDAGDAAASVRAVFSWSMGSLTARSERMFALLGVHAGPDITIPAAASLAGIPPPQAGQALNELTEANLIAEHSGGRYAMHDLLRAYATEQAIAEEEARKAALGRALDHYLHTARAAALLLNPVREPPAVSPPRPGVAPEQLASSQQARAWFDAEHHVLIAAIQVAADSGFDIHAWQLPWTMANFLDWHGHWHDWAATLSIALAAATRLGDTAAQAATHRLLAPACASLGDDSQSRAHLTDCLGLYQQLGDRAGQARVHQTLSWLSGRQGDTPDALGHAEQALALFQVAGDRAGQAEALNNVGCSHARLGSYQKARACCRQALTLYRELEDRHGEASSRDSLGYAEHQLGNFTAAGECYRQALRIFGDLGNRYCQADTLTHLGDTHHAAGDQDKAQDAWRHALAILDDLEHPDADQVRAKLEATDPI